MISDLIVFSNENIVFGDRKEFDDPQDKVISDENMDSDPKEFDDLQIFDYPKGI